MSEHADLPSTRTLVAYMPPGLMLSITATSRTTYSPGLHHYRTPYAIN